MRSDSDEMHYGVQIYKILDKMIDKIADVKDFGSKAARDGRRLIPRKHDDNTARESEVQESEETLPSTPRMREILASLTDQWSDLLKAVDELKPHLEEIAEKLDVPLEVKY